MNVPKLPFLEKKSKTEYFLSLVLRDEKASAVVFEEANGRINVVGEHNEPFKISLEDDTQDELLEVVDRAVSTAEKNLPPDAQSHKTIFGVKHDWIEEGKIKPAYLAKLKKVSDELDFKPMGFLVIPEAIAHLLQKEEGAPLSAILTEIGTKSVTLSLIRAGKIVQTKSALIGPSLVLTVESLLKDFSEAETLPPRIILFDSGKEELAQKFMSHKWSKDLPFLHIPQVMNLSANFDARAVLNGAATQMGFDILEGSLAKAAKEDSGQIDGLSAAAAEESDKTLAEAASEFGFVDEDVSKKDRPKTAQPVEEAPKTNIAIADQFREIPEEVKIKEAETKPFPVNASFISAGILGFMKKINIGALLRGARSSRKKLLIGIIPIALILLIFYLYFFARSATLTLDIRGKVTDETTGVTFSQSEETNAADNVISAQFITVSEDGKKSTGTTGKKEVGDKAKGTVTMFNSNTTGATIPTGTVITSQNDLKFVTDKAVTVASASGDIFSGTDPGKADIGVTAEKFGTNYNLPSNTKFSVEGSSSIAAKNDKPFAGGTKKEVKVVSKKDQDKLVSDLQKQLESEAKEDIKKKAEGGSVVLPNFISVEFDKKSFSKDVDDEANEVSLTATINYKGVSYKNEDILAFAKDKLEGSNGNLKVDEESIEASATDLKEKGKEASAKLKIKARLVPKLDEKELAKEVSGKSRSDAIEILNKIDEVSGVDIKVFPPIPLLPDRLPFSSGKIKIVINKNG
ncbi:MAG: baseplate J/gp47 family protein [Candidatus Levybacteria bacterium]|nr:baseplate J/gp47 family protein [Candidatus Levybacteria bacterium]